MTQPFLDSAKVDAFRDTFGVDTRYFFAMDRPAASPATPGGAG